MAALAVEGIPASATHADVHSLVSQFCAVDRVITIFPEGGTGSALVLLPPTGGGDGSDGGDSATAVLAATAAELLDCYPLEGGMLEVIVCVDPQAWLQGRLGDQLAPFGQQAAGSGSKPPSVSRGVSGDDSFDPLALLLGGSSAAAEAFNWPAPAEAEGTDGGAWQEPHSRSQGSEGSAGHVRARSGSGSGDPPEWGSIEGGGGGGGGMGSRQGSPPLNECGIVVFNLPPDAGAQEVGDFLCRFGPLVECLKPADAHYVLVRYTTPEAAAAAKDALHEQVVEELSPGAMLNVQYRTTRDRAQWQRQQQQQPQGSAGTELVVHKLLPHLEWRDVWGAFATFGTLRGVNKKPGTSALVQFHTPAAAAAAINGLHDRIVPLLNPMQRVSVEYRRSPASGSGSGGYGGGGGGGGGYGSEGGGGGAVHRSGRQGEEMLCSSSQGGRSGADAAASWRH